MTLNIPDKEYLGDAVYCEFDGHHVVLTAENGISTTNTIWLEPDVLGRLEDFVKRLRIAVESRGGKL